MRKRDRRLIELSRRLDTLGISLSDQEALRRIEMTLHRWAENECGNEHGSAIERDDATGKPYWTYDAGSGRKRYAIPDRERGALKRLAAVMARYPELWYYHQGDPRGCALYVGRKSDLPPHEHKSYCPDAGRACGELFDLDSYYTRGVAVCL